MNDPQLESIHGKYLGGALWQVGATLSAAGGFISTGWVGYITAVLFLVIGWSMLAQGRAELKEALATRTSTAEGTQS